MPSSTNKAIQRWEDYRDMKDARQEAKELKRSEKSRNPPETYGKNYSHNSMSFHRKLETYNNAMKSGEKENWTEAMLQELKSLEETKTWDLVERPNDKNVIPGKWVYKIKTKADGSLDKYKARYVAKGFKQIEGVDYGDTFARTSKPETFRLILSLAAKENFTLKQMDVKSAYLYPKIKEEIYLEQPQGFEKFDEKGSKLVCRLNKSIYGLKQAAKIWYEELATFHIQQNFKRSKNDYCLFPKIENDRKIFVLSWVDDLVNAGSKTQDI